MNREFARRTYLLAAAALVAMAIGIGGTQAAVSTGGPGGLGFTCDANTNTCTCQGTYDGADCKLMRKNCVDTLPGPGEVYQIKCTATGCECKMTRTVPKGHKLADPHTTAAPTVH